MKLVSLTIPDDPRQLADWLERHLVGLDLAALVAELQAVHGGDTVRPGALAELLGDRRGAVLVSGLAMLPPDRLRWLLRSSGLLLELQELVLTEGGRYWEEVPRSDELTAAVESGRQRLLHELPGRAAVLRVAWYRRPWVVSLATAAAVLLLVEAAHRLVREPAVSGPGTTVTATPAWGWDRPGALPADGSARAYLSALADAADEWFKKRPEDTPGLARRLNEFRRGCTTLIFAEHRPLPERERTWLVERCREWAAQLDRELADLEAGTEPAAVRQEADRTVTRIVTALRQRAEAMPAG